MFGVSNAWLRDAGERVGFTTLQAGVAMAIVELTPLQTWWAAPITVALASLKVWAAKHVGDPDSAAMAKAQAGAS